MWSVEFESVAIIQAWIRQISIHGPESIRGDFKWADHALQGAWMGYRSSSFSHRGRIVYRIIDKKVIINIARITDEHNYKKGPKK